MNMKKKMKREQKNLRRRNEVNRLMNLKVSSPIRKVSNILEREKVDRFGKVSRFVNQRGSVPSTDTEMFGCEIVRDLPDYLNDFVKKIGFNVVIKVPVSNHDGITGSGGRGTCNDNSTMMSLSFGGNRLYGYGILQYDKPHCDGQGIYSILHGHSVWNTPEGKTRCVTDYSRSGWNDDRKEILFIPVGLNSIEETHSLRLEKISVFKSLEGVLIFDTDTFENHKNNIVKERVDKNDFFKLIKKKGNGIIFQELNSMSKVGLGKYWKDKIEQSNFRKVSLSTGRNWDYFRNKILNTYFPKQQTV